MESLDVKYINEAVLSRLLSGNPTLTKVAVETFYTADATFKHPFFLMKGIDEITRIFTFWARANSTITPLPGVTQMWIGTKNHPVDMNVTTHTIGDREVESLVLDITYEVFPFLPIHFLCQFRHVARIVVISYIVRGKDGKFRIWKQEDLLQVDSILSALFPHFLGKPLVKSTQYFLHLSGLFIIYVLDAFVSFVRRVSCM